MKHITVLLMLLALTGCDNSKEAITLIHEGCGVGNSMTLTYTKSTFTDSVSLSCTYIKTED